MRVMSNHQHVARAVISVAGNDDKVAGLVFVAAFAPDEGESEFGITKPYPPAPIGTELRMDPRGICELDTEGNQGRFCTGSFRTGERTPGRHTGADKCFVLQYGPSGGRRLEDKTDWFVVAADDRVIPPDLERAEAAAMNASTITVDSSHVVMLSHPEAVADVIEQAAAKAIQK